MMAHSSPLHFRQALITGGSTGIGEALVRLLAEEGAVDAITFTGRHAAALDPLVEQLRRVHPRQKVTAFVADLAEPQGRRSLVEWIEKQRPDLLVNNAGAGFYGSLIEQSHEQLEAMVGLNALAIAQLSRAAAKALIDHGEKGIILNVSSAAAPLPFPYFSLYTATKAFATQFSLCLDGEMEPLGVRVLVALPGMVDTQFRERAGGQRQLRGWLKPMTPQYAAQQLLRQIARRQSLYTFHAGYRWALALSGWLSRRWLASLLGRSIRRLSNKE